MFAHGHAVSYGVGGWLHQGEAESTANRRVERCVLCVQVGAYDGSVGLRLVGHGSGGCGYRTLK